MCVCAGNVEVEGSIIDAADLYCVFGMVEIAGELEIVRLGTVKYSLGTSGALPYAMDTCLF